MAERSDAATVTLELSSPSVRPISRRALRPSPRCADRVVAGLIVNGQLFAVLLLCTGHGAPATVDHMMVAGSGSVSADLGLPDADTHTARAELVSLIDDIVREHGVTQGEGARLLGVTEADVSRLLRGDFRDDSLEDLLRLLTALGCDFDIVVRQPRPA